MSYLSTLYRIIAPASFRILIRNIQYRIIHKREMALCKSFSPDFSQPWKKTVCFILPSTKLAGGVATVCEYSNRLKKMGVKVIIASTDGTTDLSWFADNKVEVVSWSIAKNRIIEEFDTVVATGWITAYAAASSGIKRTFYLLQSDEQRFYPKESYLCKRVHDTYLLPFRYITTANWMQKWLKEKFNHQSALVRQGINSDIFKLSGSVVSPRPVDKIRIMVEGAIDLPFKRIAETMQITDKLPKDKYEVWLVSSSGTPKPEWKIDKYFNRVSQFKMGEIYRSCHILLKLSSVEGMAGPPLEAMACGCIPIVYKSTGMDEYMVNGSNGFMVDNLGDVNITLIDKAYTLYSLIEKNNSAVLSDTVKLFDWSSSCSKLLSILN